MESMGQLEAVFADRSERAKLRVSGPQGLWFLHQVLTQSFEDINPGEARDAAMITAHGRMIGHLEALATEEAVLCHFEAELREELPEALRRYVFATRVELEDVTDDMGLVLAAGAGWKRVVSGKNILVHPTASLGSSAVYLWVQAAEVGRLLEELAAAGARPASEDELEAVRILHGVPRWGREMTTKTFPQEVGIDERAVHYHKGCYLGQEAMAKIHFRGKVNRRLARLQSEHELPVGAEVHMGNTKVGSVTSSSNGHALAVVRHTVEEESIVTVEGRPATVVG